MGEGDICHLCFEDIYELCKHILRRISKYGNGPRHSNISRVTILANDRVSRVELGNLLESLKHVLLVHLMSNLIH